ncbi:MAG: HPr family phosphocarrier protein [Phycisphaerae bacterium]
MEPPQDSPDCPATSIIAEEDFRNVVRVRGEKLLAMARLIRQCDEDRLELTRPLLGGLLSQSSQVEELLDTYNARNNRNWRVFRAPVAALKRFSQIKYELIHIRQSIPLYNLPDVEGSFESETLVATDFARKALIRASCQLLDECSRVGLDLPEPMDYSEFIEMLPPGRLPNDRARRRVDSAGEVVTRLATAFLNLAAQADLLERVTQIRPDEYPDFIPNPVSEESLRNLQHLFHNLQSLYDTFVSDSETECLDPDLPRMRGDVSVVFHLLHIATNLAHYYERHITGAGTDSGTHGSRFLQVDALLAMLMEYCITYAGRFLQSGRKLCQTMLNRYAEVESIQVPIPRYRGFHVRPSTLVAKIVMHYGTDVSMQMDGETYDASSPLEIFRVNERINARKRRWLSAEIGQLPLQQWMSEDDGDVRRIVQRVLNVMAEQGKVVIYDQPLEVGDLAGRADCPLFEQVIEEVARLQATGRIDIHADMSVTLIGDKRVLEDIRILAENGYGEDNLGNNITLPAELGYLRR